MASGTLAVNLASCNHGPASPCLHAPLVIVIAQKHRAQRGPANGCVPLCPAPHHSIESIPCFHTIDFKRPRPPSRSTDHNPDAQTHAIRLCLRRLARIEHAIALHPHPAWPWPWPTPLLALPSERQRGLCVWALRASRFKVNHALPANRLTAAITLGTYSCHLNQKLPLREHPTLLLRGIFRRVNAVSH
jgi:hypothetical protein